MQDAPDGELFLMMAGPFRARRLRIFSKAAADLFFISATIFADTGRYLSFVIGLIKRRHAVSIPADWRYRHPSQNIVSVLNATTHHGITTPFTHVAADAIIMSMIPSARRRRLGADFGTMPSPASQTYSAKLTALSARRFFFVVAGAVL